MNTLTELQEPDAKLLNLGKSALTDRDVLALLIAGSGSYDKAYKLLDEAKYNFNTLSRFCYNDLKKFGLSHLQAVRTIALIEFGRRLAIHKIVDDMPQVRSSQDAFNIFKPEFDGLQHEEFWILLLNRANRVIKRLKISQGGVSGTTTDVRIILRHAINELAHGIIIAHNHPSGNTSPSDSDIRVTQKIKESGALMDIQVLDHIVIGGNEYYSFADNGAL